MFSLHETTQRRVCRVAFVVCAVVPMFLTLVWVAYSQRPWREADWRRTLSQQLHVRAMVEQIESPRPGVARLKNVRLADLRSGKPLCVLGEIRAQWRGSQLTLVADELRVEVESFSTLATTLATWLSATELPAVELQAERLTIVGSSQRSFSLRHARVQSERQAAQTQQLALQAILPAVEQGGTMHTLRLVVEQHGKRTRATLDTDSANLPSWLLADLLPSFARCAEATFTGSVRLEGDEQEVSGSLQGQLENLTINDWLGIDSPHRVRGTARVDLKQLTWHGDRVVMARGNLYAAHGEVSHSLLLDMTKRFYCVPGELAEVKTSSVEKMQSFDELACRFHISSEGITLKGKCASLGDAAPGCMLTADGRPLLMEPIYTKLPVAQLVQVLSQPAPSWLPASREAHAMAGKLPLPSVGSPASAEVAVKPKESPKESTSR